MNSTVSGMSFTLPPGAAGANVYKRGPGGRLELFDVLKAVGDPGGLAADADRQALEARAARNYPDSPYLQREWIRAVGVVRSTRGGWVMDLRPLPEVPARFRQ